MGGPLVIAVALRHVKPEDFRNTLFALWVFWSQSNLLRL